MCDKEKMIFCSYYDFMYPRYFYTLIIHLHDASKIALVDAGTCDEWEDRYYLRHYDTKQHDFMCYMRCIQLNLLREKEPMTPIFPRYDELQVDSTILYGFREECYYDSEAFFAVYTATRVKSISITPYQPNIDNYIYKPQRHTQRYDKVLAKTRDQLLVHITFAHTNACMYIYAAVEKTNLEALPSIMGHKISIEVGWTTDKVILEDGTAIPFPCIIRVYTNIEKSMIDYADGVNKMRSIFFDHRIRSFQRLWRKWWYEPNAEGYVRFASRMYDKDSSPCA